MSSPKKQRAALDWLQEVAAPDAWRSASPLMADEGLAVAARLRDGAPADEAPEVWLSGPRARLRLPLRDVLVDRLDESLTWLIGWLEGRWPRGKLRVSLPLGPGGSDHMGLAIRAPMPPPRLLLSQGPLPLPRESVAHFRQFHRATGTAHLVAGGFEARGAVVTALSASWRVPAGRLEEVLATWPVPLPNLDVLSTLAPESLVEITARYAPAPLETLQLTLPEPRGRRPLVMVNPEGLVASHSLVPIRAAAPGRR